MVFLKLEFFIVGFIVFHNVVETEKDFGNKFSSCHNYLLHFLYRDDKIMSFYP